MSQDGDITRNSDSEHILVVSNLPKKKSHVFQIEPSTSELDALAAELDVLGLKKLRFAGQVKFNDFGELVLTADLGVTATQECVVSLEPVRTRIDTKVTRRFSPDYEPAGEDRQMLEDEDENIDPLTETIDLGEILSESIALNLPDFPRAEGAALKQNTFAAKGVVPLEDEDTKPFAGLAALKDKIEKDRS